MVRPKAAETRARAIRLPEHVWDLLAEESALEYRNVNEQVLKLVEDFLVIKGRMTDEDRKKAIRRKAH
ncbi:MAG: hypothetical protein HOK35_17040 [Cytophagia bacterium]|nr:hypothetical protein [Candidatus Neomarinimicrobiota bacterium]MBT5530861.1 hypothetical protein [Cytophagia bacterium]